MSFWCEDCFGNVSSDDPRWREMVQLETFTCARCSKQRVEQKAFVFDEGGWTANCAWCKKSVPIEDLVVCAWCGEVGCCGPECWDEIATGHAGVCSCAVDRLDLATTVGARGSSFPSTTMDMSASKARTILHDGSVRGHPLTPKQRRLFGAIASKRRK